MSAAQSLASMLPPLRLAAEDRRASIGSRRNPASQAAILDAAERMLLARGPAGVPIDAVAREARAGKPTVYRWWPDRLSLFLELHARGVATIATPELGTSLVDDLRALATVTLHAWTTTVAGPALRAIVAESQASDLLRERADAGALSNYRDAIASVADRHGASVDAAATFEAWLGAFLFRPADAGTAIARQIASIAFAPASAEPIAVATASVRHRGDWVD